MTTVPNAGKAVRRTRLFLPIYLAGLIVMVSTTACGSHATAPSTTTTVTQADLSTAISGAKSLLPSASAVPDGWTQSFPHSDSLPACGFEAPAGHLDGAETLYARNGSDDYLQVDIDVLATPDDATASFQSLVLHIQCFFMKINQGRLDTTETAYFGASLAALSVAAMGDQSTAFELTYVWRNKSGGDPQRGYLDIIVGTKGSAQFFVEGVGYGAPLDLPTVAHLASVTVAGIPAGSIPIAPTAVASVSQPN